MSQLAELELVDDAAEFFAPVSSDVVDGLVGQYQMARKQIAEVAEYVKGPASEAVMHYFLDGNRTEERGRHALDRSAKQLFDEAGAVGALNSAYWSKALALTDVLDMMPQKRRTEWHEQIRGQTCPDFAEETVRATLATLLNMRAQFLAERVDGIFRGLSGEHVTNAPEAFGKRMIISYVLTSYGSSNHDRTGLINDLRCVIAKFMGRDEPKHYVSDRLIKTLQGRWGEWVELDGGALKVRLYKKGTAHLEVHPDMAWRLNMVLAHMHPLAIPAEFRQKPKRKAKDVQLIKRPLPFAVLGALDDIKPARERVRGADGQPAWPERWVWVKNTVTLGYGHSDSNVASEVREILSALGGTSKNNLWWEFDFDPMDAIHEIVNTGCIPDKKAHQFYPTPKKLAERVVELAEIGPAHTCLEPSAGTGGLADFMPKGRTTCIEVSALHCKVLESKGFKVHQADFTAWDAYGTFDRVVMNPPFDQGRWRAHLEHAADKVCAGGRLVAILPSGAKGTELPGFSAKWHGPFSNEFPGTSVDVVVLVADRAQ